MSELQYVGARYVPKFADPYEWQANTIYEPLTVVMYNRNSYTSKKQVPANIGEPTINPEYWVCTGNYNAQLDEVLEKLAEVEKYPIYNETDEQIIFAGSTSALSGGDKHVYSPAEETMNIIS